jgi:hypothetical protein
MLVMAPIQHHRVKRRRGQRALLVALPLQISLASCNGHRETQPPPRAVADGRVISVTHLEQYELSIIEAELAKGLPVFKLKEDGGLDVVPNCYYKGEREYTHLSGYGNENRASKTSEIGARASRFASANMKQAAEYDIKHTIYGDWSTPRQYFSSKELGGGGCRGATLVAVQVQVGVLAQSSSNRRQAGGGVGGVSGSRERSHYSSAESGDVASCKEGPSEDGGPPIGCNVPLYVRVVEIDATTSHGYYLHGDATGLRGEDQAFTAEDVGGIADEFSAGYGRRATRNSVKATRVSAQADADIKCGLSTGMSPSTIKFECFRGDVLLVQHECERQALSGLLPSLAMELLGRADPSAAYVRPPATARVVILVDVSSSMLVNDESTFITDNVRRSHRYELVMLMLHAMQENQIEANVAVVPFGAENCIYPIVFEGEELWPLSDASRNHALTELRGHLETGTEECYATTDLVSAMRAALGILTDGAAKPGGDVVYLITDGAQQNQRHNTSPSVAANELREAGVELNLIRLQLNDRGRLRKLLGQEDSRKEILGRWERFSGKLIGVAYEKWLEKNRDKSVNAILDDMKDIELSNIYLSENDNESEPLRVVYEDLLPEIGGLAPVHTVRDVRLVPVEGLDGGDDVQIEYGIRAIRGRPFMIRAKKPDCMGRITGAWVTAGGQPKITLRTLWEDGAIVTFDTIRLDAERAGSSVNSGVSLTIQGEPLPGMEKCQN